jgi:hypothetical protein
MLCFCDGKIYTRSNGLGWFQRLVVCWILPSHLRMSLNLLLCLPSHEHKDVYEDGQTDGADLNETEIPRNTLSIEVSDQVCTK